MTWRLAAALGLAGTGLAASTAMAADLPMTKAEPVEYVQVCKGFGAEFFYIPGSDTCLALTGFGRADYGYQSPLSRATDTFFTRYQARTRLDARTKTEFGDLRSYLELNADIDAQSPPGLPSSTPNLVSARRAFIQLAGFEAGFDYSAFNFYDQYYQNEVFAPYTGEQGRRTLLSYTYVQHGAFARLSVEDAKPHRNSIGNGIGVPTALGAGNYGGESMPDIVGAIGFDASKDGFGRVQLMGALHQIRPLNGNYDTEYGFAVGAAIGYNLPFQTKGSYFALEAEYADGATRYLGANVLTSNVVAPAPSPADAFATGPGGGFDLQKARGFSVEGEAGYAFTDKLLLIGFGSYIHYNAPDVAATYQNFDGFVAGANLNYTLVKGLIVTGEAYYANRDLQSQTVNDIDQIGGGIRLKRNF